MRTYYIRLILFSCLFTIMNISSFAQIDNYFMTGVKKGELDTLALERAKEIVKETSGLQEKEIDPEQYIVGPNDEFTITIILSQM